MEQAFHNELAHARMQDNTVTCVRSNHTDSCAASRDISLMLHTCDILDLSSQTVALTKWPVSLGVLSVYVDLTGRLPST